MPWRRVRVPPRCRRSPPTMSPMPAAPYDAGRRPRRSALSPAYHLVTPGSGNPHHHFRAAPDFFRYPPPQGRSCPHQTIMGPRVEVFETAAAHPSPIALTTLVAAALGLAHARARTNCTGLGEQLRRIDSHRGAGRPIVHAAHEGQTIT